MKLLTFFAVAFAAGTISFASDAQPRPTQTMRGVTNQSAPLLIASKARTPKANNRTAKSSARGKHKALAQKSAERSYKARPGKGKQARKSKTGRKQIVIDTTTTSSINPYAALPQAASSMLYDAIVARHAASNGVPISLARAVIRIESNYRPNARGRAGEIGLMQIKPATARMMGYRGGVKGLYDPETNIRFGMKYLGMAHKLGGGATCATILRYNAGHAARRMNPVSSAYCRKVQREMTL